MDFSQSAIPTPRERRERNRTEMVDAILDAARAIIREEGAAGLNLSEVARRVNLTTPALYSYFPNKAAIYDALYAMAVRMAREHDAAVWRDHEPGWECLRAWFQARLDFAMENTELYKLAFSAPVPGFSPTEESFALTQEQVRITTLGLNRLIEAGVITPDISAERARDLLLAMRHGIVIEYVGKRSALPLKADRYQHAIDDAISVLQRAWGSDRPEGTGKGAGPG